MASIWFVLGIAIVDWSMIIKGNSKGEHWSKPIVMIALGIWFITNLSEPLQIISPNFLVVCALVFSLLGDIFLLSRIDNFVAGLLSFLVAHVFYIIAMQPLSIVTTEALYLLLTALMLIIIGFSIISKIVLSLKDSGKEKLVIPVIIYGIVLITMLYFSLRGLYSRIWEDSTGLILAIGGFSFFLSDILLAWNRFVEKISNGKLIVRILYHLGQMGLVTALLLKYSS